MIALENTKLESQKPDLDKCFTKSEAVQLTESSPDRLVNLDKSEVIVPVRLGGKRPVLFYSWMQIIQIKVYDILKVDNTKDKVVSEILYTIAHKYTDLDFLNQDFIVYDDRVCWFDRRDVTRNEVIELIEKEAKKQVADISSVKVWTVAPYPVHKQYHSIQIKWNPFHSMRYAIATICNNAYKSEEIDFEEFKRKIDYDSFKDVLELE